jgi:hypothetical protein
MSTPLAFGTNNITVYSYESFSYKLSNYLGGTTRLVLSNRSSGIPASYLTINDSSATFATTSNGMTPGGQQFIINLTNASGTIISNTSTTNVTVAPGRFTDGCGNSLGLSNYTFYLQEAIPPIRLYAPFNLGTPTSSPALPPGLSFTNLSGSTVQITGTPLTTSPLTNYLVIGKETATSKVVSSTLPIIISNERIQVNPSTGFIVSGMQVGTPIADNTITASGRGLVAYSWSSLPDGIFATDKSGNTVTSGFFPSDPSLTLIIKGTPTIDAASNFRNAGYSNGVTQSIIARRVTPTPVLSNVIPITFRFGETVLFDTPSIPASFYTNVALDPSQTYFRAATYFTSNVGISNIFSPNLRTDLSLAFNGTDRAFLTGTPLSASTNTYTIRAVNSNGITRDLSASISVVSDTVTFTSPPTPVDVCYNFVYTRSLDNALSGYYPYPIQYTATSAAGRSINWSSSGLGGTGITLDVCGNTATLMGRPTTTLPLQNLSVTATADGTLAPATRDISFAIVNDVVTITPTNANIPIQNRVLPVNQPMNPTIQLTATALSGVPIRSFTATGLPPGITISRSGLISGTPTQDIDFTYGAFVNATTGFVTGTQSYTFANVRDNTIVMMPKIYETVPTVFSGVEFRTLAYSGLQGTTSLGTSRGPYQGSNFTVSIPDGVYLQGNFNSASALLPKYRFAMNGSLSNAVGVTLPVEVNVTNPPTFVRHIIGLENDTDPANTILKLIRSTGPSVGLDTAYGYSYSATALNWGNISTSLLSNIPYAIHDIAQSGNTVVAVLGSNMIRSPDAGQTWEQIPSSNIQALDISGGVPTIPFYTANPLFGCIATDGSSNWLAIANGWDGVTFNNILRTSSDDGVTWTDTSASLFVSINKNTKLFYNNSRYFVTAGTSALEPLLYADSGNITNWIPAGLTHYDAINDLAFNGNTLLAVGSNGPSSACYSSTNNGTTWTPLGTSPITYSGSAQINAAKYASGQWTVSGQSSFGNNTVSVSPDLVTWSEYDTGIPGTITASTEDGAAWIFSGTSGGIVGLWNSSGNVSPISLASTWTGVNVPAVSSKRITSDVIPPTWPSTLTLSMLYDPGVLRWTSPTQTSYINWQYVPIEPIRGSINYEDISPSAAYFFSYGLPDGLTFSVNDSSRTFDISGAAVNFSDQSQQVLAFATYYGDTVTYSDLKVLPLVLSMRTILPTVQKQQSGAGAWTYLLRQYTEVNAAVTSRDNKATPAIDYKLGEFLRPEPPSVVTESSNCLC